MSVHPSSPVMDWNGIKNWDDSSLPTLEAFARAIHAHGAAVMAQITHRGRRGWSGPGERALVSPSDVPELESREIPHALTREEIGEIVQAYAAAARRLPVAGFEVRLGAAATAEAVLAEGPDAVVVTATRAARRI